MSTTWYTSDWHLGHQNILEFCGRPFEDVEEMNWRLIKNFNSVVSPEDETYFVGDMCMGGIENTLPLIGHLNGKKNLIPGNHDKCWPGKGGYEAFDFDYANAGFIILPTSITREIAGQQVLINHFPYASNHRKGDYRYRSVSPDDEGGFLIHGHTHQPEQTIDRMFHVGVDAWDFFPVPEGTIAEWITGVIG